jgi:chorismate lyase / 3-hydroxybenzoate synthase
MQGLVSQTELLLSSPSIQPRAEHLRATPHSLSHVTFGLERSQSSIASVRQHLYAKPLSPLDGTCLEEWFSKQPTQHWHDEGISCQSNGDVLFGVIEIAEPIEIAEGSRPLEIATQRAYSQLFSTLDTHNYPYLWRAWNYMPAITAVTHGLERYRQFNAGRQLGFEASARRVTGNVPAACAIGVRSGPLSVAFLAGRTPTLALENPRQISAYNYPPQYGPRSPTFSRASLAQLHQQELLLLSGTASIVGHETLHSGDAEKQTQETLRNIEAVLAQANAHTRSAAAYTLQELQLRVYVRHAKDLDLIRSIVDKAIGGGQPALYLEADICRPDLDVEIEGIAWHTLNAHGH